MRNWLRSLVTFLWYDRYAESQRDKRTKRVHDRADRAIGEANSLIDSYKAADRVMRKHTNIWRNHGNSSL